MDLEPVVRPVVEATGLEFVDLSFRREGGRRILRVTVDRDGGVDLEAISDASQRISRRLDVEGFDPGPYHLEVSSPGLERPLRAAADFARRVGEKVKVRTSVPVEGSRTHIGTLLVAGEKDVTIETESGRRTVALEDISTARTVFEWRKGDGR